jgi:hypothetical protein
MTILTLKLNGEDVIVEFTYYSGHMASYDDPGEDPFAEIEKVHYCGIDVFDILSEDQLIALEDQIEKKHKAVLDDNT